MARELFLLIVAIGMLLMPETDNTAHASASMNVTCSSWTILTAGQQKAVSNATTTKCFLAEVSSRSSQLSVTLKAQTGKYDLYVAPGNNVGSLVDADHKLNFFPIEGGSAPSIFVMNRARAGYYTIAVRPISQGAFQIQVGRATAPPSASSTSTCSGSICQAAKPLVTESLTIPIGSEFGARAVYPIRVTCPGTISAVAYWSGTARNMALILNGPGQTGYFEREDGPSPLEVQHEVTKTNLDAGALWRVSLVNFNGGTAEGEIKITYPDADSCRPTEIRTLTFQAWPNGAPVQATQLLRGDEFAAWGITAEAAPEGSYCADAVAAIRVDGYADRPYLSTARPSNIRACNGVPVNFSFNPPVKSVTIVFTGAAVPYVLTAFDERGQMLGQSAQSGILNQTTEVTIKSTTINIASVNFGYQAAVTVVQAIKVEVPASLAIVGQLLPIAPGAVLANLPAPQQLSPPDSTVFSHYPRVTTLTWTPVNGAASYTVELDCYHCCQADRWCTDIGMTHRVLPGITDTNFTFEWVGAQPGRWRVWAINSAGREGTKSPWSGFSYTK